MVNPAVIEITGQMLELETVCEHCKGKGYTGGEIHSEQEKEQCWECKGTGYTLTQNGIQILKFVERQFTDCHAIQWHHLY